MKYPYDNRQSRTKEHRPPMVQLISHRRKRRNEQLLTGGVFAGFVLIIVALAVGGLLASGDKVFSAQLPAAAVTDTPAFAPLASVVQPVADVPTNPPPIDPATATASPAAPVATMITSAIYTIQSGDTLWSISIGMSIPMEAILAANPGLDPNVLYPGDTLTIPQPQDTAAGQPGVFGYVATEGESLRLRSSPQVADNVVTMLEPATVLDITGRTVDFNWLHVKVATGSEGWVDASWVGVPVSLAEVPIVGLSPGQSPSTVVATATIPPTTPTPGPTQLPAVFATLPPGGEQATSYPYISGITARAHEIFAHGQALGNRARVFSKVGDSITDNAAFLKPIGQGKYNLRDHAYLQPVIDYYLQESARDANSFANTSLAAKGGWSVWHEFNAKSADPRQCLPEEVPLVCEYRVVRPSVALIMLGTNDVMSMSPGKYEEYMRQVIETSTGMGVIPVVSTIPDFYYQNVGNKVQVMNGIVIQLSQEYQIPLWDYWGSMQELPGQGLSMDGIHPSWASPADFTPNFLKYGMTNRNLTALQALDAVWRLVIRG